MFNILTQPDQYFVVIVCMYMRKYYCINLDSIFYINFCISIIIHVLVYVFTVIVSCDITTKHVI